MTNRTKVQIKGIGEMQKGFTDSLKLIMREAELLNQLGTRSADYIRGATRSLNEKHFDGVDYKRTLEPSTIKARSRLSEFNTTGKTYSDKRANLTFSGQLLDSLKSKPLPSESSYELFFDGTHQGYKTPGGKTTPSIPNEELAAYVQVTRPFLFMSEALRVILNAIVVRRLRRQISAFKLFQRNLTK